jgi:hypothetical protein
VNKTRKTLLIVILLVLVCIVALVLYRHYIEETKDYKPVIYLYPEEEQNLKITLDYDGEITHLYPKFSLDNTWEITAYPDGTLTDKNNRQYYALFWEGKRYEPYPMDYGFCVKGSETEQFLEEKLKFIGLNDKEINEFIIYWLPQMEDNPYNVICFQEDSYTKHAKLTVTPKEDTMIRVFMTWYPSRTKVEIQEQELTPQERKGFTVVEWGGSKLR